MESILLKNKNSMGLPTESTSERNPRYRYQRALAMIRARAAICSLKLVQCSVFDECRRFVYTRAQGEKTEPRQRSLHCGIQKPRVRIPVVRGLRAGSR